MLLNRPERRPVFTTDLRHETHVSQYEGEEVDGEVGTAVGEQAVDTSVHRDRLRIEPAEDECRHQRPSPRIPPRTLQQRRTPRRIGQARGIALRERHFGKRCYFRHVFSATVLLGQKF